MPRVDLTLAYALPVCAEDLAVKVKTYIETLPALHTLRMCNRFGHGRIRDLPTELIDAIGEYVVEPVLETDYEELTAACRCFNNTCTLRDHVDRSVLVEHYADIAEAFGVESYCDDPGDEKISEAVDNGWYDGLVDDYSGKIHYLNKEHGKDVIERVFSRTNRAMFAKRFGLVIRFSFVRLNESRTFDNGASQAMITYLTLPSPTTRRFKYEDCRVHDHDGHGFAVDPGRKPTARELERFPRALKALN